MEKSAGYTVQTRIIRPLLGHEVWIGPNDRLVQLRSGFVFTSPRRLARDDFVNDDTKGPHVRRETVVLPEDNLGGRRLWGTKAIRPIFDVETGEALGSVFFKRAPSTAIE